jgi:N-acetylmuramoyl-L-alanine amidase
MMHPITPKLLPASIGIVTTVALFSREASPKTIAPPAVSAIEKPSHTGANQAARRGLAACQRSNFKVAVDVGHNPHAKGATSASGRAEYFFNLELAKRIENSLIDNGFRDTYLNQGYGAQDDDLNQRIKTANANAVDLFISIHHDAADENVH